MNQVILPNRLAEASYRLSLLGMRLKILAMSKLTLDNYAFGYADPITITVEEWLRFFPESENPYRDLKRGLKSLVTARVRFPPYREDDKFLKSGEYLSAEGKVILHFCLLFLKKCF
jgi:hypothetical protein